mgnify:CR=1 FL=1|jgi:hypothetical protein
MMGWMLSQCLLSMSKQARVEKDHLHRDNSATLHNIIYSHVGVISYRRYAYHSPSPFPVRAWMSTCCIHTEARAGHLIILIRSTCRPLLITRRNNG